MRKALLHIGTFSLMIYMLLSTMGVMVYEHHCKKTGTFYGVYSEFDHHCEDAKKVKSTSCGNSEKSCCKKPSNQNQVDENCCTTNVNWIQLDVDLSTNDVDVEFDKDLNLSYFSNFSLFRPQFETKTEAIRGPPPKLLKPSQSSLQCYLI